MSVASGQIFGDGWQSGSSGGALPSKCEVLSSNPSATGKTKQNKNLNKNKSLVVNYSDLQF
jgi:hypothetical protein